MAYDEKRREDGYHIGHGLNALGKGLGTLGFWLFLGATVHAHVTTPDQVEPPAEVQAEASEQ